MQEQFMTALVMKAVRRYIDEAIHSGSIVSATDCAADILRTYPACTLSQKAVADEVIMAAARAGVAVEYSRREHPMGRRGEPRRRA